MAWEYSQSSGQMKLNGELKGTGYSGRGEGRNNPAKEAVANVGPIPRGAWTMGAAYDDNNGKGPTVIPLTPSGHNAHGRTGFLIHGDNATHDASTGCIILGPAVRTAIAASADKTLNVV